MLDMMFVFLALVQCLLPWLELGWTFPGSARVCTTLQPSDSTVLLAILILLRHAFKDTNVKTDYAPQANIPFPFYGNLYVAPSKAGADAEAVRAVCHHSQLSLGQSGSKSVCFNDETELMEAVAANPDNATAAVVFDDASALTKALGGEGWSLLRSVAAPPSTRSQRLLFVCDILHHRNNQHAD